ncbi:Flp pilus assembly pilin Flp [Paenibacillus sp. DS2015]|uniref:hypothetical protein n=1 Tax=Paenibacillus sp. DS2015 TaxID=3373917 RepID=UPI003D205DA3
MKKKNTGASFWKDESGDVSIKGIAITVAILVIVGLALVFVKDKLDIWLELIWNKFMTMIDGMIT